MEKTISINDIIIALLKKWKLLLIVSLVFAVVSAGYIVIRSNDASVLEEKQLSYEMDLIEYEQLLTIKNKEIKTAQAELDSSLEYMQNSVYYNTDAYNKGTKEILFSIDAGYKVLPDMVYQEPDPTMAIALAYENIYKSDDILLGVSEILKMPFDSKYINELVSVSSQAQGYMVKISVSHADLELASKAADFLFNELKATVSKNLKPHTVNVLSENASYLLDRNLEQVQTSLIEKAEKLEGSIALLKTQQDTILKQKPEEVSNSLGDTLRQVAKYFIIGFVLGLMCICTWVLIEFFSRKTISCLEDISFLRSSNIFCSIFSSANPSKNLIVSKIISKLEKPFCAKLSYNESFKMLITNLKMFVNQNGKHLLCVILNDSNSVEAFFNDFVCACDFLNVTKSESVLSSLNAVEQLALADYVLVVVSENFTQIPQLTAEIECIKKARKEILGVILIKSN